MEKKQLSKISNCIPNIPWVKKEQSLSKQYKYTLSFCINMFCYPFSVRRINDDQAKVMCEEYEISIQAPNE